MTIITGIHFRPYTLYTYKSTIEYPLSTYAPNPDADGDAKCRIEK